MPMSDAQAKLNETFPNYLKTIQFVFGSPDFVLSVESALGKTPKSRPSCERLLDVMPTPKVNQSTDNADRCFHEKKYLL